MAEYLLGPLRVFFSNNVDVKVTIDPLLDDFKSDSIVFFFFPSLSICDRVSLRSIYYIPDLFFLKYDLSKVSTLRPILEVAELFSFVLMLVILVSYFADFDNLKEGKKCNIGASVYTKSYNLMKYLIF